MDAKEIYNKLNGALEKFKPGVKALKDTEFLFGRGCPNALTAFIDFGSEAAFLKKEVEKLFEQKDLDCCVKQRLLGALYSAQNMINEDIETLKAKEPGERTLGVTNN